MKEEYPLKKQPSITITKWTEGASNRYKIDTEHFTFSPLYSKEKTFDKFEEPIKELYKKTFGSQEAVKDHYGTGKPHTEELFQLRVTTQSQRWEQNNPFAAFIITKNEGENEGKSPEIVGSVVLGHGIIENRAEAACLTSIGYRDPDTATEIGWALGAWGQVLYNNEEIVNKGVVHKEESTEGHFWNAHSTTRVDNEFMNRVLQSAGYEYVKQIEEDGVSKNEYVKNYLENSIETEYSLVQLNGTNGLSELVE